MAEIKKEYLNIWEQVEKNKNDIISLVRGAKTLADFGIKVIGYVSDPDELPDPDEYLQDGGEYGDAFAIAATEEPPYEYYVFTRPFEGEVSPQWFNIGEFPKAGPQGPAGQDGEQGERGERGLIGPQGPKGATGNTGATGPTGPAPTIGENGNWYRDGVDTGLPSRGPQGEQGEPGTFFHIKGQVDSEDLLPDASEVDIESAYCVGTELPYDVYAIMDVEGVHYWINLGPVAVVESDTKVGSLLFSAMGTLSADVLNAIANTTTLDCLKIGDRFFVKQSTGHYYALKRDSGQMLVYACDINLTTGEWVITTETMVDLDTAQSISGDKNFIGNIVLNNSDSKIYGNASGDVNIFAKRDLILNTTGNDIQFNRGIKFSSDNNKDIGSASVGIRNLYAKGQVYAQNTFNVINASDIVSNTLTQAQYDLITNGKPTLIKGTFLAYENMLVTSYRELTTIFAMSFIASDGQGVFYISKSDKTCTMYNSSSQQYVLRSISAFNGKTIPAYPTSNSTPQVLSIAANGGALSWVDSVTTTGYTSTDNTGSISITPPTGAKTVTLIFGYQGIQETFEMNFGEFIIGDLDSSAWVLGPKDPEVVGSYWYAKLDYYGGNVTATFYLGSSPTSANHAAALCQVKYIFRS